MVVNLQTDPWPVVLLTLFVIGSLLAGAWWLTYFWERMWSESLSSRSVNRRVLRWQRVVFRGHLPFGRWGGTGRLAYLRFVMLASRTLIVVMAMLVLFALVRRLFGHAG